MKKIARILIVFGESHQTLVSVLNQFNTVETVSMSQFNMEWFRNLA